MPENDRHCAGCGQPTPDCPGCLRELDPPRFCEICGRRLRVLVNPVGYEARCRDHGVVVGA
jgi:hypothetical protein